MTDSIASFALRGATREELGHALSRCFAEFWAWHGEAVLVASFADDARSSGVKHVLVDKIRQALEFAEGEGLIINTLARTKNNEELAYVFSEHQLAIADHGMRISAIVMLHNACERFLWRLVRFGLAGNRAQILKWIEARKITLEMLRTQDAEALIDAQIENWWHELERGTLAAKWDRLVEIVGFPADLSCPPWHFDRKMLVDFDSVRHNAVHHDAQAVKSFDFANFANQLWRVQLVWIVHVASLLQLKIPAEMLFGGK